LLRASLEEGRQWFRPVIDVESGVLAWLRGEFDAAASHFEQATAHPAAADRDQIDALWFVPSEPIVTAHLHLGWARLVRGDFTGAEAALAQAACRADELVFPQGPLMHAYTGFFESWICIEAGRLDRAAILSADMVDQAQRHGFDMWQLAGATQRAIVSALAALGADLDPSGLSAHIATLTTFVDTWRTLELNAYSTFFDAVLGRLLIAADQREQARARLDTGLQLAEDTGMCFYDAELLRLRAHTQTDPDERRADIAAALDLARRQGATLFELRAALDDFDLRGEPARAVLIDVVERMPADNSWPELERARLSLSGHSQPI
jgi:tetratricopeptide (TPR) repeat protein